VPAHYGSAFILEVGEDFLMIDCGPATTYKIVQMGIAPGKIGHVFFTHHHFDHNADFPCFALTRWDFSSGREPALKVYGPPPTAAFVDKLFGKEGAFFDDWNSRIQHPVSQAIHRRRGGVLPRPAPKFDVKDVGLGEIAGTGLWQAIAARVHHVEPWLESLALRFDTEAGSIVFAGDCGDCPALRQLARDADTLVAACACIGSAKLYDNIITGTADVVQIAQAAGVRRVILSHGAPGFARPEMKRRAIDDVKRSYPGSVSFPEELRTVDLSG
jgi:ribonuclease BN (tRNA processing enzyme)